MGVCVSSSKNRTCADTNNDHCFICYKKPDCVIGLDCNHTVHAGCLARWWTTMPDGGLRCPMCRRNTYQCYLEIDRDRKPIGYYRHDNEYTIPIVIRVGGSNERTTFERLPSDASSRNKVLNAMLFYNVSRFGSTNSDA